MSKDGDVEMKDVELNELDQEKQLMTDGEAGNGDGISPTGTEKNGIVKVKIPEEDEVKFTGLSKEELLKVAGTPGWVRTRWALLVLFWLGWAGMLAGAIAIIIRAPRCKPLPDMNWWNEGPLYHIGDVSAFSKEENLKGVTEKMNSLAELKVKGLVLGPIHVADADQPGSLNFLEVKSDAGSLEEFRTLIKTAHKNHIKVVLDLTPNYKGGQPWFANGSVTDVAEKLKPALVFWLKEGVDGVQLRGVERLLSVTPGQWADIRAIVQNSTSDKEERKGLFGITERTSAQDVSSLLSSLGVDLLISGVLQPGATGMERAKAMELLYAAQNQTSLSWSLGDHAHGHLASFAGPKMLRLNQMLLFTLPGTPVFNYGDEIGLEDEPNNKFPKMIWDSKSGEEANSTEKERASHRNFFLTLSELRCKERSLLYGSFQILHNSTSSLAFLRQWDQSHGYLAAFNWGEEPEVISPAHASLPPTASVAVSTDTEAFPTKRSVTLSSLKLGPGQAVLLEYPYVA